MKNWNFIEDQLGEWVPRSPSPKLKQRLFTATEREVEPGFYNLHDLSRWLVPAFGCFMLVLSSLSSRFQESHHLASNAVVGSISPIAAESNFFNRVAEHSDINSVPFKRLEYNFGARAPLTFTGAYLVSHTNRLME